MAMMDTDPFYDYERIQDLRNRFALMDSRDLIPSIDFAKAKRGRRKYFKIN